MNRPAEGSFGSPFERVFVSLLAMATGIVVIYLAIQGPLFLNAIKYKTAEVINNQLVGQDVVNLFLLSPILIAGGIALFLKKRISKCLLIATPLFLIYFVLSYTIGWEWSSPAYTGNSQAFTFHFLFILIAALIILFYSLAEFPKNVVSHFKKRGLIVYSALFSLFLKKDPAFLAQDLAVFSALALIIFFGFFYVRRNYTVG